jgi:hypothetical protein
MPRVVEPRIRLEGDGDALATLPARIEIAPDTLRLVAAR